jgi:hypothetical protein
MSLIALYDELLGGAALGTERDRMEIANRAALLREQVRSRLADELGLDEHSFALPVLAAYLANAVRLYLLGFYDSAIIEAESRLSAALHGRLHGGPDEASPSDARSTQPRVAIPLAQLLDEALAAGTFSAMAMPPDRFSAMMAGLRDLGRKRQAIDERNRSQGLQITVLAPASGALSGGPGAAHTEPILGYYLSWGADLHHRLIDAVLAVTIVLQAGDRGTHSLHGLRPSAGRTA